MRVVVEAGAIPEDVLDACRPHLTNGALYVLTRGGIVLLVATTLQEAVEYWGALPQIDEQGREIAYRLDETRVH